jgi:diguanylate cyclase (GGDEF)-like protein
MPIHPAMPDADYSMAPAAAQPGDGVRRALHPRRWLAERRLAGENGSAFGFGARLFVTILLAFALIGVAGYVLETRNLEHRQIADYSAIQQADAKGFERVGAGSATQAQAIAEIDHFLNIVEQRPGTSSAILVDPQHVVRASGNDSLVGTVDHARRIVTTLEHGTSYAGPDSDLTDKRHGFEFVAPVKILGARYAYEVTYDRGAYDAQLSEARRLLLLVGLLALFGGGGVFYLAGGRRLMRDHQIALQRATRDGLTDLPNQRAFQDELPQAVASAARYQDPLALIVLDADDFKFINDRRGHPHGDLVLKRVAAVLREARPGDRPYRVGGDEFALLLAHTDSGGARTLARRLSRSFTDAGIEASVGVSALRVGQQADTLRAEADAAHWLRLAVERAGLPIERVVVEVTERFGGRTAAVVKCLGRLRRQGFRIALDDVGTGNSGLEMLRKVDAEFVKLDRSIVTAAPTEPSARAVLMAMATFARQTGAFVIAEGIEDEETLKFLRGIGSQDLHVDTVIQGGQGFELGRPSMEMPPGVGGGGGRVLITRRATV